MPKTDQHEQLLAWGFVETEPGRYHRATDRRGVRFIDEGRRFATWAADDPTRTLPVEDLEVLSAKPLVAEPPSDPAWLLEALPASVREAAAARLEELEAAPMQRARVDPAERRDAIAARLATSRKELEALEAAYGQEATPHPQVVLEFARIRLAIANLEADLELWRSLAELGAPGFEDLDTLEEFRMGAAMVELGRAVDEHLEQDQAEALERMRERLGFPPPEGGDDGG
jgi:hypothetical protein